MTRQKHKPQRTCIACREVKDKRELIRIVQTPEGELIIDLTGKAKGRGAYLCRQVSCWEKGLQKERLARALKVSLSTEALIALRTNLQAEVSKV